MCWVHDYQGSTLKQVAAACGIGQRRAKQIQQRFEEHRLIFVEGDQIYLGRNGCTVYAAAEGTHVNRVRDRQKALMSDPTHRKEHGPHCREVAQIAVYAKGAGVDAYSGVHAVFDYPEYKTQIRPDVIFVVKANRISFPPLSGRPTIEDLENSRYEHFSWADAMATFIVVEVERRAGYVSPVPNKLHPFWILRYHGIHISMALVTKSPAVAEQFLREGAHLPIVATTWRLLAENGFDACWATDRGLDSKPTNPMDPEYEALERGQASQYVDFVNSVDSYAKWLRNPDWTLPVAMKYGWLETGRGK